ncbi:VCBS repeat-containing protein [Streptomyces formicae]|uniref:VCBS repeat-containing protein n=1 Tax=Streptomyces formicae TaxID=1616117 RepID=A0ABY3WHE0_9ACTN|nr:VCBS repeat-containing protein [Streptomyces formicae]
MPGNGRVAEDKQQRGINRLLVNRSGRESRTVEGLRLIRALPRRTTAGVAALVAAALGATLLIPQWVGEDGAADRAPVRAASPVGESAAQAEAVRTGKRVEVTSLRGATSTTYALPDRSFELTAHAAPVRAKVNGKWRPIDTALERTKRGWAPKAAADPVVFSDGNGSTGTGHSAGSVARTTAKHAAYTVSTTTSSYGLETVADETTEYTDLVTFTSEGHEITIGWPGELPEPVVDGASALYRDVFDGVDLMLTARDSGFGHVLIVHSPEAAANPELDRISYRLTSPDLTFHLDPVTKAVSAKDSKGQEIAGSPTPFMWDSAGKPAVTEGADPQPGEPSAPAASRAPSNSAEPAAAKPSAADASGAGTFALPQLSGPEPGTHRAVGNAAMTGQGARSAVLTIVPDRALLDSANTVWPAFIDPSVYGKTKNWTTTYAKHPDSSFYDGANYNTGTTEARVGYESTTGGLSRSFFRLGWSSAFKGATVSSATIKLLETYSWSCEAREVQLWHTDGISSGTTWNRQPAWKTELGRKSFAHGYNSSCPDAYVTYDGKAIAQDAADAGWTNFTIGLRASTENSSYSWKKFKAEGESAPKITIVYNRKPAEPSQLHMTPGPDCDTTAPYASVGKSDLVFDAKSTDPDGDLKYLDFEVWQSGSTARVHDGNVAVDSTGKASISLDGADGTETKFVNGKTYFWRVRALDNSGAASTYAPAGTVDCGFVYDSTAPNSPDVSSAQFPMADDEQQPWSTVPFGTGGDFKMTPAATGDGTVRFVYSFNFESYHLGATVADAADGVPLSPPYAGPNILYVKSVDAAGNMSPTATKYLHYVRPRDSGDQPGDVNGDTYDDLLAVDSTGNLRSYGGDSRGDLHVHTAAAHDGGKPLPDGFWKGSDGSPTTLISHTADWYPGDGITDMLARTPDGKLSLYPGDGYGSFDIRRRLDVLLPANAPDPATLTEIVTTEDITGDKLPDVFAIAGDDLWAFTGYTGGAFKEARLLHDAAWADRDILTVADFTGDGVADMLFRAEYADRGLQLRHGKPAAGGGVDLNSLALAGNSATGKDEVYGTAGWGKASMPLLRGTPDATGDGIPDFWAVTPDGKLWFYPGGRTAHGSRYQVGEIGWTSMLTLG